MHEVFLLVVEGINSSLLKWGFGWDITVFSMGGVSFLVRKLDKEGRKKGLGVLEREMSNNHISLFKTQLVSQPLIEAVPDPSAAYSPQSLRKAPSCFSTDSI